MGVAAARVRVGDGAPLAPVEHNQLEQRCGGRAPLAMGGRRGQPEQEGHGGHRILLLYLPRAAGAHADDGQHARGRTGVEQQGSGWSAARQPQTNSREATRKRDALGGRTSLGSAVAACP
jgi:hypothetical protein